MKEHNQTIKQLNYDILPMYIYQRGLIARICLEIRLKYLAILEIGLQYISICGNYIAIMIAITTSYHVVLHKTMFVGQLCY